jgi:hypothetical protein
MRIESDASCFSAKKPKNVVIRLNDVVRVPMIRACPIISIEIVSEAKLVFRLMVHS